MEKELFTHLDYLLPTHNCVTIPELGAFIINLEDAVILNNGEINPPQYTITFNPEIAHNDGILSSYIIKDKNITYNAACNSVKESVKKIKSDLKRGETISCGNIGSLKMNTEDCIVFTPNRNYIHPDYIGLYQTRIRRIEDINNTILKDKRYISLKYLAGGIAATAAAILLFVTPSISIKNSNSGSVQRAGFLSSVTSSLSQKNQEENTVNFPKIEAIAKKQDSAQTIEKPARIYYIIVGGEHTKNRADRLLTKIQDSDFPNADIVESPDRYRIYVASFYDKKEAESFLDNFRKENPEYGTAWLFSKRNN